MPVALAWSAPPETLQPLDPCLLRSFIPNHRMGLDDKCNESRSETPELTDSADRESCVCISTEHFPH